MRPAEKIAATKPLAAAMLPPNATALERALLSVKLARQADIAVAVILTIWNPWTCPDVLLSFLAWALSVDVWDDGWSVIEKRREIALSPKLHRLKGTRWAVKAALDRLGLPGEITEWWEPVPARRRGTFRAFIDVVGVDDTIAVRSAALARIRASKPKSRVVDLQIGIREAGPLGIAAGTATTSTIVCEPYVLDGTLEEAGPLGIAAATWTRTTLIAEAA